MPKITSQEKFCRAIRKANKAQRRKHAQFQKDRLIRKAKDEYNLRNLQHLIGW